MPDRRITLAGILGLAGLAALGASALFKTEAIAAPPPVTVFQGAVNGRSAQKFFARVADQADKIVGLKVMLDPDGKLVAEESGDGLVLYLSGSVASRADTDNFQLMLKGGFARDRSFWRVDGFYTVKYGGMGQGIMAYALEPVKESDVLLSGAKLKTVEVR